MALLPLLLAACFLIGSGNEVPQKGMGDSGGGLGMANEELMALYDVVGDLLDDPSWAEFHPHPCTDTPWPGIQCELIQGQGQQDPLLHVTKLHIGPDVAIPPCKASAKLSKSLLKLPYLKTFSLFNCFVTPVAVALPPSLFTNASSLVQLVVKSNPGLSGEIPSSIGKVGSLRVLSLSQNNFRRSIPKELGGLRRLEQLDLSYNHLTGNIPEEIGGLTSLTILDLCSNKLEGDIPWSIGQLQDLQKLDLSSNKLSGKIPSEMGDLQSLVLLDLSYNSLTGPLPQTLSGMEELQYLLIENNPIGTAIPSFLGALRKLDVLGFSSCGLSGPIPTFFGSLCNLTALYLDRNKLNGSVPPSLGLLPKLGLLNLSQNQLSGEISFLEGFVSRLGKRLDVRDNKGLCTNPQRYQNLSLYLEVPPCLDSTTKSSNGPWTEEPGVNTRDMRATPSLGDGKSNSNVPLGNGILSFLWCLAFGIFVSLTGFY